MKHTVQVPMRWSDMDAYQHINNVAFLGYFEMARVSLFFEHPTHDEKTGMRRGLVVHSHEITYKRPSSTTPTRSTSRSGSPGSARAASFTCHYEAFDHGQLAATGRRARARSTSRSTASPPDHPGGEGFLAPALHRRAGGLTGTARMRRPLGTSPRPRTRSPPSSTRTTAAS